MAGGYLSDGHEPQECVYSLKLSRDLAITQKSAWHMNHRLRKAFEQDNPELIGSIVKVDETCIGGKERNKHEWRKQRLGRGPVGKAAVVGAVHATATRWLSLFQLLPKRIWRVSWRTTSGQER